MTIISFLNLIYIKKKINHHHIVVMMTFVEDVLPIIEALNRKSYEVTVIAKESNRKYVEQLDNVTFIPAGNKKVFKHINALSTTKTNMIDTDYLSFAGSKKKSQQTIIQTRHAFGALKNFGPTDHQVDLNNKKMVNQYKNVYRATDKYLVGGEPMVNCFKSAFGAKDDQFLRTGLPRLVPYVNLDIKQKQQALKLQYGINDKLALYVPTYREQHNISLQSLMVMADVIITDYSSLAIEASLLNKPTLFYVYDEANYEKVRGLNSYYYEIPEFYKAYSEEDIVHILQTHASALMP